MRETSAKTVTRAQYFSQYNEATMAADGQIADTTQLLLAWAGGDAAALDALARFKAPMPPCPIFCSIR